MFKKCLKRSINEIKRTFYFKIYDSIINSYERREREWDKDATAVELKLKNNPNLNLKEHFNLIVLLPFIYDSKNQVLIIQ